MAQRFNMEVNESIAKDLTQELTAEVSSATVMEAYINSQGNTVWDKTPPSSNISYTEHKLTFFDAIN
jgi:hypothetical protein